MSSRWGEGTFVVPAPREVDALMKSVRKGRLTTIDDLRKALAIAAQGNHRLPDHDRHFRLDRRARSRRGGTGRRQPHHTLLAHLENRR